MHAWSLGSDVLGTAPASVGAASCVVTPLSNASAIARRQTRVKFAVQTPAGRPRTGNASIGNAPGHPTGQAPQLRARGESSAPRATAAAHRSSHVLTPATLPSV